MCSLVVPKKRVGKWLHSLTFALCRECAGPPPFEPTLQALFWGFFISLFMLEVHVGAQPQKYSYYGFPLQGISITGLAAVSAWGHCETKPFLSHNLIRGRYMFEARLGIMSKQVLQ